MKKQQRTEAPWLDDKFEHHKTSTEWEAYWKAKCRWLEQKLEEAEKLLSSLEVGYGN